MSIIRAIRLAGAVAVAGLLGSAAGQDATLPAGPGAAPAAVPQYQVEVLVFSYRDFDPSEEVFAHRDVHAQPIREQVLQPAPVFDDTNYGPRATSPSPFAQSPPVPSPPPAQTTL